MLKYLDKKGLNWQEEIKDGDSPDEDVEVNEDNEENGDDSDDSQKDREDEEKKSEVTPEQKGDYKSQSSLIKPSIIVKDFGNNSLG